MHTLVTLLIGGVCPSGNCLEGDKHRELPCPQPETSDYRACFQWSDSTCCTAESTTQLANATVVNVDGFHWSRCDPPLSQRCQEYFKRIECFYRSAFSFSFLFVLFFFVCLFVFCLLLLFCFVFVCLSLLVGLCVLAYTVDNFS